MRGGSQNLSILSLKIWNSCYPSLGNSLLIHVCIMNPPKQAPRQSYESISPELSPNGGGLKILGTLF